MDEVEVVLVTQPCEPPVVGGLPQSFEWRVHANEATRPCPPIVSTCSDVMHVAPRPRRVGSASLTPRVSTC